MAKSKKSSERQKQHYKAYQAENRWEKNKIRRLTRHCQHNPNDFQAAKVLDTEVFNYMRNNFKNAKPIERKPKLKLQPVDNRETLREQLQRINRQRW